LAHLIYKYDSWLTWFNKWLLTHLIHKSDFPLTWSTLFSVTVMRMLYFCTDASPLRNSITHVSTNRVVGHNSQSMMRCSAVNMLLLSIFGSWITFRTTCIRMPLHVNISCIKYSNSSCIFKNNSLSHYNITYFNSFIDAKFVLFFSICYNHPLFTNRLDS